MAEGKGSRCDEASQKSPRTVISVSLDRHSKTVKFSTLETNNVTVSAYRSDL